MTTCTLRLCAKRQGPGGAGNCWHQAQSKTQGGGKTSNAWRQGRTRGPFRALTNFDSPAMLTWSADKDRHSRREVSAEPQEGLELAVCSCETSKSASNMKTQAPSLQEIQRWMEKSKSPIRDHTKRGWWTLPDTDNIKE